MNLAEIWLTLTGDEKDEFLRRIAKSKKNSVIDEVLRDILSRRTAAAPSEQKEVDAHDRA